VQPCPENNPAYTTKSLLKGHLERHHAPSSSIPAIALTTAGIVRCGNPGCSRLYCSPATLLKHQNELCYAAQQLNTNTNRAGYRPPRTLRDREAPELPMPTHAEHKKILDSNRPFFDILSLDSDSLHELQNNSIKHIPQQAMAAFATAMIEQARAITADLAAADTPTLVLLCLPRLLLSPPPPDLERRLWPALIRSRTLRARNGECAQMWAEHSPPRVPPSTAIAVTQPESYPKVVNDVARWGSVASVFKAISKIPFAPCTEKVHDLILDKIKTEPITYSLRTQQTCAGLFPAVQGGARYINLAAQEEGVTRWLRRTARMPHNGQPDGTGLRITHFTASADIVAAFAVWFEALLQHRTTPALRAFLRKSLARAQCKQQTFTTDDGKQIKRYPKTATEISKVRPLKTHNILRRVVFGFDARLLAKAQRRELEAYGQYGMSPDGCSAAARKLQLNRDLRPEWPHFMSDGINAYGELDREFSAGVLDERADKQGASDAAKRQRIHFYAFYVEGAGVFYIQVGNAMRRRQQCNGIDQGDTHGNLIYNITTTLGVQPKLAMAFHPFTMAIIHDDTTGAAPGVLFSSLTPPRSFEEVTALAINLATTASFTGSPTVLNAAATPHAPHPIPFAALIFAYFLHLMGTGPRVPFEIDKTLVFTANDASIERPAPISIDIQMFPAGTALVTSAYRLAGCFVYNMPEHAHAALAEARAINDALVYTFVNIPQLKKYVGLRAMTECCRPTAKYNHHLRGHPPSIALPHARASRETYIKSVAKLFALSRPALELDPTSLTQLFLPTAEGGAQVPCPVALAAPCFTASMIDTLGMILADPTMRPLLSDTSAWPDSPSATLNEFYTHFKAITGSPHFTNGGEDNQDPQSRFKRALFNVEMGSYTIDKADQAANMNAQHALSRPVFRAKADAILHAPPPTSPHAPARLRACALPDAMALFQTKAIDSSNELSDLQATFMVCNALGIHHPFIINEPTCHPSCPHHTPDGDHTPLTRDTHRKAYHALSCAAGGLLKARHNDIATAIAAVFTSLGYICQLNDGLGSSSMNGNLVDIVIANYARSHKPTAIDVTVSNPMLDTYRERAMLDAHAVLSKRDEEKTKKHGPGSEALGRTFIAAVFTTFGGFGGRGFRALLKEEFDKLRFDECHGGGTGYAAARRKTRATERLAAALHRGSARMASELPTGAHVERMQCAPALPQPARQASGDAGGV